MQNKKFKITIKTPTGKKVVSVTERNAKAALQKAMGDKEEMEVINVTEKPLTWLPKINI